MIRGDNGLGTTALTKAECEAFIYRVLAKLGTNVTSWQSGAWSSTFVVVCAYVFAALSTLQASIINQVYRGGATGNWLTLVARWRFGVERGTMNDAGVQAAIDEVLAPVYSGPAERAFLQVARTIPLPNTGEPYRVNRCRAFVTGPDIELLIAADKPTALVSTLDVELVGTVLRRTCLSIGSSLRISRATQNTQSRTLIMTVKANDGRTAAQLQTDINSAIQRAKVNIPIGGWNGVVPSSWFTSIVHAVVPQTVKLVPVTPMTINVAQIANPSITAVTLTVVP